jgi:hypothetical protein
VLYHRKRNSIFQGIFRELFAQDEKDSIFGKLNGFCWALADAGPAFDTFLGMDRIRFIFFHLIDFARADLNAVPTTLAHIWIYFGIHTNQLRIIILLQL